MIREERASRLAYEPSRDVLHVVVEEVSPGAAREDDAAVDLLLDAAGHLVGVDLGGEGFARIVVMLGPHEAVASSRPARARVAKLDGRIAYVAFGDAKRAARGGDKSPYVTSC